MFKAHRLVYHSTLGLRVIMKEKKATSGEKAFTPGEKYSKYKSNTRFVPNDPSWREAEHRHPLHVS